MNRRHFIHTLMLTAGAASATGAQFWKREPQTVGLTYRHQPKLKAQIALSAAEEELARVLRSGSKSLYLFGGPVLARAKGKETSWMNFLVDCQEFSGLKNKLFKFGVEPLSTPDMPGTFIKFVWHEKIYNVMNCGIDQFCQINRLQSRVQLIPFAHNFLIYDCKRREVADPCGAFEAMGKDGLPQIKLVARPRALPEGFDCVLSGRFETGLLGFTPSEELRDFDNFILNNECPEEEVPRIVERAVNYLPDAIEILGEENAGRIALSPLVRSVVKKGLAADLERVWSELHKQEPSERSAAFIGLLKEEMGTERSASGFEDDLTLYLAKNGYALRRSDLALQAAMS